MNIDHFYTIGNTHEECQDYARSSILKSGLAFACVTDGCSGSHDRCRAVDVGARLLALAAEDLLNRITCDKEDPMEFLRQDYMGSVQCLGREILNLATSKSFESLPNEAFDCTLLFMVADAKRALLFCYGDGVFVIEKQDGTSEFHNFGYSSGAPYFLSYDLDADRSKGYGRIPNNVLKVDAIFPESDEIVERKEIELHGGIDALDESYNETCWYVEDYKHISVLSDGIGSFEDEEFSAMTTVTMAFGATNFKNYNGAFVRRRMRRFLKNKEKENLTHYDDLSIATIWSGIHS